MVSHHPRERAHLNPGRHARQHRHHGRVATVRVRQPGAAAAGRQRPAGRGRDIDAPIQRVDYQPTRDERGGFVERRMTVPDAARHVATRSHPQPERRGQRRGPATALGLEPPYAQSPLHGGLRALRSRELPPTTVARPGGESPGGGRGPLSRGGVGGSPTTGRGPPGGRAAPAPHRRSAGPGPPPPPPGRPGPASASVRSAPPPTPESYGAPAAVVRSAH